MSRKNIYLLIGVITYMWLAFAISSCKEEDSELHSLCLLEFSPTRGQGGTQVLINGEGFPLDTSLIKVTINNVEIPILRSNEEQLLLEIPENEAIGTAPIQIEANGQTVTSEKSFEYLISDVTSFSPTSGGKGTIVQINLVNVSPNLKNYSVVFNGEPIECTLEDGYMLVTIPQVEEGLYPFVITLGNKTIITEATFEYKSIRYVRTVSVLAGSGEYGYLDGPADQAKFSPTTWWNLKGGICVDANKNIFVSDPWSISIRKITPDGMVKTFAGYENHNPDEADPTPGAQWRESQPKGASNVYFWTNDIKIDNQGNIYNVNMRTAHIIKFNPEGLAFYMGWQAGHSCALDEARNRFYVMLENGDIYSKALDDVGINPASNGELIVHGTGNAGGMEINKKTGDLYITDTGSNQIFKYEYGKWENRILVAGSGESGNKDGAAETASFDQPWGLAFTPEDNLLVAGSGVASPGDNNPQKDISIRHINLTTKEVTTFAGSGTMREDFSNDVTFEVPSYAGINTNNGTVLPAAFQMPCSICCDEDGTVYVIDRRAYRVMKITTEIIED